MYYSKFIIHEKFVIINQTGGMILYKKPLYIDIFLTILNRNAYKFHGHTNS